MLQHLAKPITATLAAIQLITPIAPLLPPPPPAEAVLSSPKRDVPRSVDAALRRAIPLVSPQTKDIQDTVEDIAYLLRIPQRKPFGTMVVDVEKAIKKLREDEDALISIVPDDNKLEAAKVLDILEYKLARLQVAIDTKDPDRVSIRAADALSSISDLAILQAPGLPYLIPPKYSNLPRLTGRATVEMVIQRGPSSKKGEYYRYDQTGTQSAATLRVELDGYSAPLTAGHFGMLLQEGYYTGMPLRSGESSLFIGGPESGRQETPTAAVPLPLELLPAGDFNPLYNTYLDIQGGEMPTLPLSVYGALAMGHGDNSDSDPMTSFFYLFDNRASGLGGLSFDEGTFAVFGYVTEGRELLPQLDGGDVIKSIKFISGLDKLIVPNIN
eukprot:CAMPEP_0197863506 /NCGR_PEP_ID=MMETSP1438-20131217/40995_1 /TAXON_ID=1461541 /ORGANISM="Pterosperma sp., Strain CCMP1384" /LENGTH=383 /DNA_ID=CAMNT_0043481423 /DNA_START=257 /DNA_END=1408 /DNA_ORIENTATION=-